MLSLALPLLLAAATPACDTFAAQADTPVAVRVTPLAAADLGKPDAQTPASNGGNVPATFRFGELIYRGEGLDIRSDDPRFAALTVDRSGGVRHPCGYPIFGPSGWNARDKNPSAWTIRFERPRAAEPSPGAVALSQSGARPELKGEKVGPSWPVFAGSKRFFIAAVPVRNSRTETRIVAFADRAGPVPTRQIARLAMPIDALSIVPELHGPGLYLNLDGRMADGALRRVVLKLDQKDADRIADELTTTPPR